MGMRLDNLSAIAGASSKIPAVARTDRPNPNSTASHGSEIKRMIVAIARAFRAQVRRPRATMTITLAAITPARSTLGSGPMSKTYSPNPTSEITVRPVLPNRKPTAIR